MMADNGPLPWTIRGVPEHVRKLALDAAKARDIPLGQWISYAIRQTVADKGDAVVGEIVSDAATDESRRADLALLYSGLSQVTDKKGCGDVARITRALIAQHLVGMGLSPRALRSGPEPKQVTDESAC